MNFYDFTDEREEEPGFPIMLEFDKGIKVPKEDVSKDDTMKEVVQVQPEVPAHPIASMQGAFAESMREAHTSTKPNEPKMPAETRRKILLDQNIDENPIPPRWRQNPWQQYHQLSKLMAQISFGIYLLLNKIAKDDDQVMKILQGHVDEVDEYLEIMFEDFDLAQDEISERLLFLQLPLENISTLNGMLVDRSFRLQIVEGNERIEHIITRTAAAMNEWLRAIQQGMEACKEFNLYLAEDNENRLWRKERPEMGKVYDAMKGNVEGWYKAFVSLQTKGNRLGVALVQLGSVVAEMDRRAGEISRQTRFVKSPSPPTSPPRQSRQMRASMSKNLPIDPNFITPAIRATLPAFSMVQDRDPSPEPEDESSESQQEPEVFILKPRTYTPTASPKPPQGPIEKQTQVKRKNSPRKRFSLKKRESSSEEKLIQSKNDDESKGTRKFISRQSNITSHNRNESASKNSSQNQNRSKESLDPRVIRNSANRKPTNHNPNNSTSDPPSSRGLDSAYCSKFEKPLSLSPPPRRRPPNSTPQSGYFPRSQARSPIPAQNQTQSSYFPSHPNSGSGSGSFSRSSNRSHIPANNHVQQSSLSTQASTSSTFLPLPRPGSSTPPTSATASHQRSFSPLPIPSPLSDPHPFFRSTTPVQASPHSPLQRPWTAAPTLSPTMRVESGFGMSSRRNLPSAIGGSVLSASAFTVAEGEGHSGKKDKKGRKSVWGKFKKAFTLSEEEKMAFEERKRGLVGGQQDEDERDRGREMPRFLDGRKIR